jgi:hypothetical protein
MIARKWEQNSNGGGGGSGDNIHVHLLTLCGVILERAGA